MIIAVNTDTGSVSLTDPDTFTAFNIEATGDGDLAAALAGHGAFDGEHGWFTPDEIRALAGDRAADPEWRKGFAAMADFAAEKGFCNDEGAIRAHVES